MAWDPNEKGNYAWLAKEARNHGGVENYINDIEENAKAEAHEEDMKLLVSIIVFTLGLGTAIGAGAVKCYDKFKQKIAANKELKQKSDVAKEALTNGVKAIENNQTSEIDLEDDE